MAQRKRPENYEPYLTIRSEADADRYIALLQKSAGRLKEWIAGHDGDALDLLRRMKFEIVGDHPIEDRPLNVMEQINQTWTYAVALAAAKELLRWHPEAGGLTVAPGAHMSLPLDIMSVEKNVVGAETFAAVHPRNNGKLQRDLAKLAAYPSVRHRYVFFSSPSFPGLQHRRELDAGSVEVWSVAI